VMWLEPSDVRVRVGLLPDASDGSDADQQRHGCSTMLSRAADDRHDARRRPTIDDCGAASTSGVDDRGTHNRFSQIQRFADEIVRRLSGLSWNFVGDPDGVRIRR